MTTKDHHATPRLLFGPGPANVDPNVLKALATPVQGHLDPELVALMDDLKQSLRQVFRTKNDKTLATSGTGSSGMEACLVNVVTPGDKVIVGRGGYFGGRLVEVARRVGANVIEVAYEPGQPVEPDRMLTALRDNPDARVVAVVHAETSTGVHQPLDQIGRGVADTDALFLVDCVTSLGGVPLEIDAWHIDLAYSCTQKCLGMVSGLSPVTFSPKAMAVIEKRTQPVASFYLGLDVLGAYWSEKRVYHHTACSTLYYGLAEALRMIFAEGLEARWQRHREAGQLLQSRLQEMGCELFSAEGYRLPVLTAVLPPAGIDAGAVRVALLNDHHIEVGAGLGDLKNKMCRIGLMGYNASQASVDIICGALATCMK